MLLKILILPVYALLSMPDDQDHECPYTSGLPLIIGADPMTRDGNTEITTFNNAPVAGAFIVGATTWSPSVTETKNNECV